ncbi:MAG TPA: hypothetical protein VFH45_10995, partial [Acidimicrobiales bacterium]|nr:hypothetical protein [Acidimicrobiales bacterium]
MRAAGGAPGAGGRGRARVGPALAILVLGAAVVTLAGRAHDRGVPVAAGSAARGGRASSAPGAGAGRA